MARRKSDSPQKAAMREIQKCVKIKTQRRVIDMADKKRIDEVERRKRSKYPIQYL